MSYRGAEALQPAKPKPQPITCAACGAQAFRGMLCTYCKTRQS